ncbi:GNAT family protein [Streptomyces sp. NPDC126499]|uniref:GNAT family N-acetyltransferase n=1 Tax=Streptomyces sp. NPDC126499 TaxID=3155314 RepID=UPI003319E1A7
MTKIPDNVRIRPGTPADAAALADALLRNRAYLRPWEPRWSETYYTAEGQAARLGDGRPRWFAVVDGPGRADGPGSADGAGRADRGGGAHGVGGADDAGGAHGVGGAEGAGGGHGVGGAGEVIVGSVTLSGIALGPFRSASLGYWVAEDHAGRGLATALVEEACRAAREELGLHRIEACTLLHNHASQRVLDKCGFERIGTAPRYLHIDGDWRDHHLFQRVLHDDPPPALS